MNSLTIEILRKGQAVNQLLSSETDYVALVGTEPAIDLKIPCNQEEFNKFIALLRYNKKDAGSRQSSIDYFQDLITNIIQQVYPEQKADGTHDSFIHLRLVTTPKEIAQLPFELALTPSVLKDETSNTPFFINPRLKTTFTRELRQSSSRNYSWPFKPRILFAWAL